MLKRLIPVLFLILVLAAACDSGHASTAVVPAATEPPAAVSVATALPAPSAPAIDVEPGGARAQRHVQVLAGEIGPRVAASPSERQAADYIAARLREYGFQVELQPFPLQVFTSRSIDFQVIAPQQETVRVGALTNSAPGTASGELFVAGFGRPGDYPAAGIGGRVALVQRGQVTFGDMARNAAAAGATALIVYDPTNDVIPGRLTGTTPPIPALSIPGADGLRLRAEAESTSVRVKLAFDGGVEAGTATNVIGRPPGKGCAAVVGGHYDTVPDAPGGSDNASGTAAVLEMARVQALRGNPEGACFIAFSGEELGLLGSQYYLGQLGENDRRAIRFMINLDMVGVGESWALIGSPTLTARAREVANATGVAAQPRELVGASSDHAAFIDRHIPALMLHRWNDTLLHTPQDTADRVDADPLAEAVRLGLAFLAAFGSD